MKKLFLLLISATLTIGTLNATQPVTEVVKKEIVTKSEVKLTECVTYQMAWDYLIEEGFTGIINLQPDPTTIADWKCKAWLNGVKYKVYIQVLTPACTIIGYTLENT